MPCGSLFKKITPEAIRAFFILFAPLFYGQGAVFYVVVLFKVAAADLIYAVLALGKAEHVFKLLFGKVGGVEAAVEDGGKL